MQADRPIDPAMLERASSLVVGWLADADAKQRMMALEALQVAVTTTREAATVTGVLPTEAPTFITDEQSCRCTFLGDKPAGLTGVPFVARLCLA